MTRIDEIPGVEDSFTGRTIDPRDLKSESIFTGESGAVCTQVDGRYDLICPTGLRRLAQRYALGAEHYGDYNWCKAGSDPKFQRQRLNHLVKHVVHYLAHGDDGQDDDLAAIAWNAFALMHYGEGCRCHEAKTAGRE